MAVKSSIKLSHTNVDTMYIDPQPTVTSRNKIRKDLDNIIADLERIEKVFKTFKNDKSTKGSWDKVATNAISKSNKYQAKLKNDKQTLVETIGVCYQDYVMLGDQTEKAAAAVNSIDVG